VTCPEIAIPLGWMSFLVGICAGMILLAIVLHYVDKAMRH
jgi:hypothetical protein